ncbi:MAG: tetratricopeptide repeat protein [Thermodesulfobacteriota bacterium]
MTHTSSLSPRLLSEFGAALILCAFLALGAGCALPGQAPRPQPPAPAAPFTPGAEAAYHYLVFEDARNNGRVDEAARALDRLLALAPSSRIYLEGANFLWRAGKIPEARDLLKKGLDQFPDQRELYLTLATTYYAEKRYDDAVATLQEYLVRHPEDMASRQESGAILIESKQFAAALDVLSAIPKESRNTIVLYYMAKANAGLGKTRQALSLLRAAVKEDPSFQEAWVELAFLYEMDGDYVQAEKTYGRLLELGETSDEVWLRLITLNLKLNNPDKALSLYRRGPSDTDFSLEAAGRFLDEKFYDQAAEILEPLAQAQNPPVRVWFSLAVLAFEGRADSEKALDFLEKVPTDDPSYEQAFRFRIHLLSQSGKKDAALALVSEGKRRSPGKAHYWLLESQVQELSGDLAAARTTLEQASEKWPQDTELLYGLGIVLDKLKDPEAGIAAMERIIAINPDHADALNYVGYTLADQGKDLERALVLIRKAMDLKPESGYIVDSLAWAYYRMGKLDQAWEEIQRAVVLADTDPIIWEHYGDLALAKGLKDKAREGYRRSLKLDPDNAAVRAKLEAL